MQPNLLYYGDNLDVMRRHVADESIDLVYLDPPFNSNADYNVLFAERGTKAAAQIRAFEDTWEWNEDSAVAYEKTVEQGGDVAKALVSFRKLLGDSDMLAYLSMMSPRLIELRRVMKPTGSLFLHCDPTASHHLKLLLDATFGQRGYRNEIIWHYFNKIQGNVHRLAADHDSIFWYTKGQKFTFHPVMEEREGGPKRMLKRRWDQGAQRLVNAKDDEGHVLYIERTHRMADDVWRMPMLQPASREKLGYPTQKPLALLARIIRMASDEDDVVLDPFCGCGTALDAAQALRRRWVGIDITHIAIGLIRSRLIGRYGPTITDTFRVIGEPTTVDDAAALAGEDPYQFQAWALGLMGARHAGETKKGADQGIDGRLNFHDEPTGGRTKQIIASVKAGHVTVSQVRDLRGVLDREGAEIGVVISFEEPTGPMRSEAASAGFYTSPWGKHPRIQLLTVGELLAGKRIDYPPSNATFRQAERAQMEAESLPLPFGNPVDGE
jgi:site-specific DNA-methyltransferase (adenine-specific)